MKNFDFYDHHLEIEIQEDNRLINQINKKQSNIFTTFWTI